MCYEYMLQMVSYERIWASSSIYTFQSSLSYEIEQLG